MSIQTQFTEEDWQRTESNWRAWWAGELERPLVMIWAREANKKVADLLEAPLCVNTLLLDQMKTDEILDLYQAQLETTCFCGDAFPKWWPNFGPGIIAGFLGAEVKADTNTVWFGLSEPKNIPELHLTYDANNTWWRWVKELTTKAVKRWGDQVCVGHTDLGGNLDILASFRTTEQLLLDLHDQPKEVERLLRKITQLWIRYYDELDAIIRPAGRGANSWAAIWSTKRSYMLQSDFSYMISPEMFERFVLKDLVACCNVLDHAFYHMDGRGQIPHLEMLLSLEKLRGIQWVPGEGQLPTEEWLDLLKKIRGAGKLCQLYVSAVGARTIIHELGGKGFALCIMDEMTPNEAHDFLSGLED
ncbi:MAG: hypothetical protein NTX52_05005 [Planctomycetota bacterium]|nr:hypothetical protein [Planctomycetota bacterium]